MLNVKITGLAPLFTLDEAKTHLRVESSDDDQLITSYSDAAVSRCLQYCNISLVPRNDGAEACFKVAALMLLTDIYEGRAGEIVRGSSVANMIDSYRLLRV